MSATTSVLPRLNRMLRQYRNRRLQQRLVGPRLLRAFAAAYPDAFFVEIGANDGEQHDHLRSLILAGRWRGIMVEPVPYVFERLRRNYGGNPRLALENVAIADRDGELPFYHLAQAASDEVARLPRWYDGIGSFNREAVVGHARIIKDIESRLVETRVPCLTFDSLCRRHQVEKVDLVAIDVEGYDAEIVGSIDLATWRPRLLVYEHYHLPLDVRERCAARVREHGYETKEEGFDTWCVRPEGDDALTRAFRRLRPAVGGLSVLDEPA